MNDLKHCWHPTGSSWGTMAVVQDGHKCCHCGEQRPIRRLMSTVRAKGHGPHFVHHRIDYEWPTDDCPARTAAEP